MTVAARVSDFSSARAARALPVPTDPSPARPAPPVPDHRWAIVLAGGEGRRLTPLVRQIVGEDRPKQYAPLVGMRSLLRQTLDRVTPVIPAPRTVVVTQQSHAPFLAREPLDARLTILAQPENRDTALGILFPVHWISWQDPEATVAIFPSDHFVGDEAGFMAHAGDVLAFVDRHPERLVLLGARPTAPETEYGWIEPGDELARTGTGPIYEAWRFREKPTREAAIALHARGWFWNTFVLVAKVRTLIAIGEELLPDLHGRLAAVAEFAGTRREAWAVRRAYADAPAHNFSEAVLQSGLRSLAVSELPAVTWSDLGTPRRVFQLLRALRVSPPWLHRIARARRLSAATQLG